MNFRQFMSPPLQFFIVISTAILLAAGMAMILGAAQQQTLSVASGVVVGLFNFSLLGVFVERVLAKKSIALSFLIIVFKWAIVLGTIYLALKVTKGVDRNYFLTGLVCSIPLIIVWAAMKEKR